MEFEIEHWPNPLGKHALLRLAKGYVKGWILMLVLATVMAGLYMLTFVSTFRTMAFAFLFVIVISPLLPIVSFFQRNRKNPSYGINKDGFLLNERGWDAAFFTWDEIASIKEFHHPQFGRELHFEFVSFTKALNKPGQDKFAQSLAREYSIEKQPKKISSQLVKGDLNPFIDRFIAYFEEHSGEKHIPLDKI